MTAKTKAEVKGASPEARIAGATPDAFGRLQRAFTGKIGRLPEEVRLELNWRLQNSVPTRQIVDWLNALPEAQDVMREQFGGALLTEDNVNKWRKTGYPPWLAASVTLETLRNLALSTEGMDDDFQCEMHGKLSILMTARFAAELQRYDCMEDGPAKTEAWKSLVASFMILRRADYYAVKVREDSERAAIKLEHLRKLEEANIPLSPEQREDAVNKTLGMGRYEVHWDHQNKVFHGPGAALMYEEREIERQVRLEMDRRYPNGYPAGYPAAVWRHSLPGHGANPGLPGRANRHGSSARRSTNATGRGLDGDGSSRARLASGAPVELSAPGSGKQKTVRGAKARKRICSPERSLRTSPDAFRQGTLIEHNIHCAKHCCLGLPPF